ncbi:MAG TPA: serine hydrolase [Cyanobacteria bacterium UBA8803]|nr:serine hydrolase [Cyanobacteria bacterium UBA9273]HBL58142.1 serine hydrolase [Cyanobacteria bacterium UBA8803]
MKLFTIITLSSNLFAPVSLASPSTPLTIVQMQLSPQAALERLFNTPQLQSDWFAPIFLDQIPLTQIQQVIAELQQDLGAYQRIELQGDRYLIIFERGQAAAQIFLNSQSQIAGLSIRPQPKAVTLAEAIEQLKTFPGQVNFLVLENGSQLAALNPEQPLAVGSTFKLAVLAALRQQIESGQRSWQDVVELQSEWKSLPSGILQTWPDGSVLTLQTLATLMISMSDNTATDILIQVLGREPIEAFTERNRPFLTTREAFILKDSQHQDLLGRYRASGQAEQRQILAEIAKYPLPDLDLSGKTSTGLLNDNPTAVDIEWFFTPQELCQLMAKVAELPLMSVNPGGGLANPDNWSRVAYKGGSEPGVLNLTTWLETNNKTYCVVATWNNADVSLDETRLYKLYSAVLKGLEGKK